MKPGTKVDQFEIGEPLGQGGMGVVFRAQNLSTGEQVALKTVKLVNEYMLSRIRGEIRTLARIEHPGIVRICAHGVHLGLPWYAMELLEGINLGIYFRKSRLDKLHNSGNGNKKSHSTKGKSSTVVKTPQPETETNSYPLEGNFEGISTESIVPIVETGSFEESESIAPDVDVSSELSDGRIRIYPEIEVNSVLAMIKCICEPLAYLHGEGVVHRDLKPDNIIIQDSGRPVIVDFGLFTRFSDHESRESLEVERAGAGTLYYIAPEQIRGEFVDSRADLYSLGCILYELLTGCYIFYDPDPQNVLMAHLHKTPRPPSQLRQNLNPELDDLVLRLLAKDPRDRIGYAGYVAGLLRNIVDQVPSRISGPVPKSYLYRSRFAGRNGTLIELEHRLQQLVNGQGGLVLVGGESGIGKTRLLMEFGRRAAHQDVRVLTGSCTENSGRPLEALLKLLQWLADYSRSHGIGETQRLLGIRGRLFAQFETSFSNLPGLEQYPEPVELPVHDAQMRLFSYLAETLKVLASDRLLLIILDDLHWADELVFGFLLYLTRIQQSEGFPVLCIGAYRREEIPPMMKTLFNSSPGPHVTIDRLDVEAVDVIVSDMLAMKPAPEALTSYLIRHSEGNPLYVAEYLRAAVEHGFLFRDNMGNWKLESVSEVKLSEEEDQALLPLPDSIHGLVKRRLAKLSSQTRLVLQAAAIIGHDTDEALLIRMMDFSEDQLLDAISEMELRHIVERTNSGLIAFVHSSLRNVTLNTLTDDELKSLHLSAAEGIEELYGEQREEYLAELAFHYEQAGIFSISCSYFYSAAKRARRLHEIDRASEYLTKVLYFITELENHGGFGDDYDLAELYYQRAELYELAGKYDQAMEDFDAAITKTKQLSRKVQGNLRKAKILEILGKMDQARDCYHIAFAAADTENIEQARALMDQSWFEGELQGQFVQAEQLCTQARRLVLEDYPELQIPFSNLIQDFDKYQHYVEATDLLAQIQRYLGVFASGQGRYEQAQEYLEAALMYFRKRDMKRRIGGTSNNLGNLLLVINDLGKAREHMENYLTICEEIGDRRGVARASSSLGHIYFFKGDTRQALIFHEKDRQISEEIGEKRGVGMALGNIGLVYQLKNEYDQSLFYFQQCLDICRTINYRQGISMALGNMGIAYLIKGELAQALDLLEQDRDICFEIGDRQGQGIAWNGIGRVYTLRGDFDEAETCFSKSLTFLEEIGDHYNRGIALLDLVELVRHKKNFKRVQTLIEQAKQEFSAVGDDAQLIRCFLTLADCELDRENIISAADALNQAKLIIDQNNSESDELSRFLFIKLRLSLEEFKRTPESQQPTAITHLIEQSGRLVETYQNQKNAKMWLKASLLHGQALLLDNQIIQARQILEQAQIKAHKLDFKPLAQEIASVLAHNLYSEK